ncbi:MAG: transcription termination/antitermination protein NusG [Candidatus Parcubacteria bacterium]|nr:MAG: transcription termination/antitermination protein NusG [Candidatus Parcubacteria bacterium]
MPKQKLFLGRSWYAIHTVIGFEDIVAESIMKRTEAFDMKDKIFNVLVPKEKIWEIRGGKRELIEKKIYPGYVFIDMIVTDDSWYLVRNTPKVLGFIGTGTTPVPVNKEEIEELLKKINKEELTYETNININDLVQITQGVFKGMQGKVADIDKEKGKLKIIVSIFNRETPVEVDILQVKKIS